MTRRPLVTFFIASFNQARLVGGAIDAAFRQTYTPLEILMSDDASSDASFEVMRRHAAEYRGPHLVRLNRNETNLGVAGHVNRAMTLAGGELVTVAAGDDVSLPNRVARSVEAWQASEGAARSVHSAILNVDATGAELGLWHCMDRDRLNELAFWASHHCGVTGSSHTWHRSVFDRFGPLDTDLVLEDMAIPFRSVLLGTIEYVEEPLVRRLRHEANIGAQEEPTVSVEAMCRFSRVRYSRLAAVARQQLRDFQASGMALPEIEAGLRRKLAEAEFRHAVVSRPLTAGARLGIRALRHGVPAAQVVKRIVQFVVPTLYWRALRVRGRA